MRRSGILLYPTELCAEEEATEICMVGGVVALMPSDAVLFSLPTLRLIHWMSFVTSLCVVVSP